METIILVVSIVFGLFMIFALFKYANFIHHYPHHENKSGNKTASSKTDEDKVS